MEIIAICPNCSNPAIEVPESAVLNIITDEHRTDIKDHSPWYICTGPSCDTGYFNGCRSYTIHDMKVAVWFKTESMNTPVCYCSNLTRQDIKKAVEAGCKTIDDVQNYTQKNITGKCTTMNVLGGCCRNVFLYEIDKHRNS